MPENHPDLVEYASWLRRRGRAQSTVEQYCRLLRRLLALEDRTAPLLEREKSPMYRHTMAAALRSWATFAEDDELAARLKDLKLPARLRRGTREPLEREQWLAIAAELEADEEMPKALRAALLMMTLRGLRCGDVLRLGRKALLEARRTGSLRLVAKGERLIHVNAEPLLGAIETLLAKPWKDAKTVADLITSGRRECRHASSVRAVRRALDEVADRLGIDKRDLYPHRFRHTYVHFFLSELRGDPEALVKVQQQMGWARMETAGSYMRRARQAELDAVEFRLLSGRKKSH